MIPLLSVYLLRRIGWGTIALLAASAPVRSQPSAGNFDTNYNRGVELQNQGDFAGAQQAYEAALKLSPNRIEALSNLGLVYAAQRRYASAVRSFQNALTIAPKQPIILFNLGITYLQASQCENARRTLAELVDVQPGNFNARHYLGVALLRLGRTSEGISQLEAVAASHPEIPDIFCTLASAYIADKQFEKAKRIVDQHLSHQDTGAAHLVIGSYHLATENFLAAVHEFRRAQQLNSSLPELSLNLGSAYSLVGDLISAIPYFEARIRRNPSDFQALEFLGWLYLQAERVEDARNILVRAQRLGPDDPVVLFQLARVERQQGNLENARQLLERVLAHDPDHLQAHVLLAQVYFRLKRAEDGKREREIVQRLQSKAENVTRPDRP